MSVAVGLGGDNHVVLCADRQLTDANAGLKFEEGKVFFGQSDNNELLNTKTPFWKLGFSYVGDPDAAGNIFADVAEAIEDAHREEGERIDECFGLHCDYWRSLLLPVFASKDAKRLETLIALQSRRRCFLFKTKANQVVIGGRECIGGGDSSVLRYFTDVVSHTEIPTADKALTLGIYLVSLASRYVDGCGLGANALVLEEEKPFRVLSKMDTEKYAERFAQFERKMEKEFFRGV
jgi:hypothetical protein